MSFRDKIAQRIQEKDAEPYDLDNQNETTDNVEAFVSSEYFGVDNLRNSPACLDLRLSNGSFKAIPYPHILEISFDPSDGIEIISTTKKITIAGRNLKMLYNYLAAYRVKHVQTHIGNDLEEDKILFVKNIKIEEV